MCIYISLVDSHKPWGQNEHTERGFSHSGVNNCRVGQIWDGHHVILHLPGEKKKRPQETISPDMDTNLIYKLFYVGMMECHHLIRQSFIVPGCTAFF